jgi:probable F420-dependent oxidoreductase
MTAVSLALPVYGAFPEDLRHFVAAVAASVDSNPIATVWIPDHVRLPGDDIRGNGGVPYVDEPFAAWPLLGALAAVTDRVQLGTMVTPVPLRHPVLLAHEIATVDALSTGRIVAGLGAGWNAVEFEQAGIPFHAHQRRIEQTCEGVRIIRRLLDGERVDADARFYDVHDASVCKTAGVRRVPIWLAGGSLRMLNLVAQLGDGWITTTNPPPEVVERGMTRLRELLHAHGRDPADVTVAVSFVARVSQTTDQARRDVDAFIRRGEFEGFVKEFLADSTLARGIWGSARTCYEKLRPYLELGVDEVILDVRPPDYALESIERICGELAPLVAMHAPHPARVE